MFFDVQFSSNSFSCIVKIKKPSAFLIPNATDGKAVPLIVVVAVHIPVVVVHVPVPGVRIIVLGTTPPVAVVAHIVEATIVVVAVAARKGRKYNSHFTLLHKI